MRSKPWRAEQPDGAALNGTTAMRSVLLHGCRTWLFKITFFARRNRQPVDAAAWLAQRRPWRCFFISPLSV